MSTSLKEQLLRLQTPQTQQFVDSKRRDSILFTPKDAATKSRETIFEIGLSGFQELISMDESFAEFENSLFNITAKEWQRAVETKEVNDLLNKTIKRFMYRLSPYFMIPASHKCLEWLIRRFNINLYNKEELLMLILPYHQTNMFVRCVQTMKFDDPSDKWTFLADVKKKCSPLAKISIWNYGASQPSLLDFVGKFTYEAIKEHGLKAGKLQTLIAFYLTTCVGVLEHTSKINDNHILGISKYLIKAFKTDVVDYTAAGYMIFGQLVSKTTLNPKLLYELMDKLTKTINAKLSRDCILLLALIFQTQSNELKISDKVLANLMQFKNLSSVLRQIRSENKIMTEFYKALVYKLLLKIQEKCDDVSNYRLFCEEILSDMDDDLAYVIIRTVLDSYFQENKSTDDKAESESEIISLDSDDENIPLKSQDITMWYSGVLKTLERQYPTAFDLVVKNIMTRNPHKKRNGLKNVLGFLLNVSIDSDANVFENLYHHNPQIRTSAISYLINNLKSLDLSSENTDILKMTLSERLSDDSSDVVDQILKMDREILIQTIGTTELIAKMSKILMRYWVKPDKWEVTAGLALDILTSDVIQSEDPNIILLTVAPFFFVHDKKGKKFVDIIKKSNYGKTSKLIKDLPKANINEYFIEHATKLPSSESLFATILNCFANDHRLGSFSESFAFYLLGCSLKTLQSASTSYEIFQWIKTITNVPNFKFNDLQVTDTSRLKNNEMSINLLSMTLIAIINSTDFNDYAINFSNQNDEMKLIFEMFQNIVDLFFKVQPSYRCKVNEIMMSLLNKICDSDESKKLQFFSQFCTLHSAYNVHSSYNLELQIRAMGLLNHVLKSGQINVKNYPTDMYHDVLISFASKINKIREFGIEIATTLLQQKESIAANWKFFFEKIIARKDEILMDNEQIGLIFYLLSSKKGSKYIQDIVETILKRISNESTNEYIQSELIMLLKHLNDRKVLEVATQVTAKIINDFDSKNYYFNENHSAVIKLVLMKFNPETMSVLWELALKSLRCHHIMNDENGKIITPSILLLRAIDDELFSKLHPDHKVDIFTAIIECSMNEQARIVQAAQKVFFNINLDYKIVRNILMKISTTAPRKNEPNNEIFTTNEWRFGVALLELLQNKSKGTDGQHELLPILFEILETCMRANDDSNIEYTKQIILSLILTICKKISPDGCKHRSIPESVFKTELIIKCIKESQNPQTHHHSLLLLTHIALMIPEQVLRDITTIFTFVGTALVRHDDSYSFQIITKIIENIIPNLLKSGRDEDVIPILKTFAAIVLDVPIHRRLLLYVKLINTLGAEKYLWMFIGTLLETQVTQHQKGSVQEDLPARLQVALTLAKEFDIKTIIISAKSLIAHLKDLPMIIDAKEKPNKTTDNEVFSIETHSNNHLRHYKYIMAVFLKNILESAEVINKANQMSNEMILEMKGHFKNLILNILLLIPDLTKLIEKKHHEKSWQIILQITFDILEASIALLAPDMLLIVVKELIRHDFLIIRKKVIELLNKKLEDEYFNECKPEKLLDIMIPLKEVYETLGKEENSAAEEIVQQLALVSVKLLARKLSEDHPDCFIECINYLASVIDSEHIRTNVMTNLIDCVSELISDLKVHSISLLGKIMPNIIKMLTLKADSHSNYLLLYSATLSLLKIIEAVPLFMSPYIEDLILQLNKLAPKLKTSQDSKASLTIAKIDKIWELLSSKIPLRILLPSISINYDAIMKKRDYKSIESLMELMYKIFENVEIKEIKNYQSELTELFLKALQFRCRVTNSGMKFNEVNEIELFIIRALIALILKLSEGSFRPLFENISNWAIKNQDDEEEDFNRVITFFRLTSEISVALKSLFLLFASDLVECAGSLLDKCNSSKANEIELCFGDDKEKNLYLIECILSTLNTMFLNDHQNFINSHRFDIIMQPIIDQIENEDVLESDGIQQLIRMCIAQLAVTISDDILWKQLNYQVLLKTRSDNSKIRIFGLKACVDVARKLTEDFETLIPETIPFLSELLEDEDHQVVQACQNAIRELENYVSEPLQKYF